MFLKHQPQKGNFAFKQHGQPLFLSRVDPNDGHGSAQSNVCDHKCWRAKARAALVQFTYKQYAPPEHWPYLMLLVGEGGGAPRICNCRFTRQDPTAYPSSEVSCLRDKCIKFASRSCLGKRTVSRNHAILARDFKGNKQFAKKGNVPLKKHKRQPVQTLEAPPLPCKSFGMEQVYGRKQLSIQNI